MKSTTTKSKARDHEQAHRTAGRPKRDAEETRMRADEILEAATSVFAEHGYRNTDVQIIADKLGIGKGTIYRHFDTKQDLFFAAVDKGMEKLLKKIEVVKARTPDFLEQLPEIVHAYLEFFDNNRDLLELFVQERAEFKSREKSTYFLYKERHQAPRQKEYLEKMNSGLFRDLPVEAISEATGALLYGAIFTAHFSGDRRPLVNRAKHFSDILLEGILSDEGRQQFKKQQSKKK